MESVNTFSKENVFFFLKAENVDEVSADKKMRPKSFIGGLRLSSVVSSGLFIYVMLFKAKIKNTLCHRAGQYGQKITSLIFFIPNSILIEFFSPCFYFL